MCVKSEEGYLRSVILEYNFISLVIYRVYQEKEPQTAHHMSKTWRSRIADTMLTG